MAVDQLVKKENPTPGLDAHNKLCRARSRLLINEPWYGHVAMGVKWQRNSGVPTMGVRVMSNGTVECAYNEQFVDEMTVEETYAVIMHELEHLVRLHCTRFKNAEYPNIANIACDMVVNGRRNNPRIGCPSPTGKKIIPMEGNIFFIPENEPENETAEFFYRKLLEKAKKNGGGGGNDGDGSGNESGEENKKSKRGPQLVDDHGVWKQSTASADEARQIVKSITDSATNKAPGNVPGHLQQALSELGTALVAWSALLKQYIGTHVGNRRFTWSRRNRHVPRFGMKGTSHHAAGSVSVIVDTSGSVDDKMIERFFAEIEMMCGCSVVSVLQWDHDFQDFWPKYRRGDWRRIKVNGRGGTDMAAPMDYLRKRGLVGDVVVMLTDGECNWPEDAGHPAIFVIANDNYDHITPPQWGNTIKTNSL